MILCRLIVEYSPRHRESERHRLVKMECEVNNYGNRRILPSNSESGSRLSNATEKIIRNCKAYKCNHSLLESSMIDF